MSLTILHGEHVVNSRNQLQKLIERAGQKNAQINRIQAKNLQTSELQLTLGIDDLFAQPKIFIIESLHSLPRSKRKNELIDIITKNSADQIEIILWEKKSLTTTQLKQFPHAKSQLFKLSSALFTWLDLFGSQGNRQFEKLDEAIRKDGKELCFLMLARQLRFLIAVKSGKPLPSAPFMQQKFRTQANQFSKQRLFQIHQQLTFLDFYQKTGKSINLIHEIQKLMLYS